MTSPIRFVSSEERREDPFVVAINAVVVDHRVALTAAGYSEKGAIEIRRCIVAAGRGAGRFRIENIRELRDRNAGHLGLRRHASRVNGQGGDKLRKVLGGWANQLPLA